MYSLVPMPPPPNLIQDTSTSTTRSQSLPSAVQPESFSPVAPREPLLSADNAPKRTESATLVSTYTQGMIKETLVPVIPPSDAIVGPGPVDSPMDGIDGMLIHGEPPSLDLSAEIGDGEEEDDDDDGDTEIEIDDDGLRSVDSCLSVLFEVIENEPHKRICALCRWVIHTFLLHYSDIFKACVIEKELQRRTQFLIIIQNGKNFSTML
jgi:hypothetical protein